MHLFLKNTIYPPFPNHLKFVHFGMGCFWGVEKKFWNLKGVWTTAVGYAGGQTSNPNYEEVCSGESGHAEVVRIVYNPKIISLPKLLKVFWESHDPTQGMRQGNDIGSQYRSIVLVSDQNEIKTIKSSKEKVNSILQTKNYSEVTTEIETLNEFFYAEDYHQQYLLKNPNGYCALKGLDIKFF